MKNKSLNIRIIANDGFELIDVANALFVQNKINEKHYREFVSSFLNTFANNFLFNDENQPLVNKVSKLVDECDEYVAGAFASEMGSCFEDDEEPSELRSNFMEVQTLLGQKKFIEEEITEAKQKLEDYKQQTALALKAYSEAEAMNKFARGQLNKSLDQVNNGLGFGDMTSAEDS
jgi:hypothetical protein